MAFRRRKPRPSSEDEAERLEAGTNPLARVDDGLEPPGQRPSQDLIYESIMRSGGEPFGTPFEVGLTSLTDKVVRFFKQRSFFGFETYERNRPKRMRNRFTRHGASRFFGAYDLKRAARARTALERDAAPAKAPAPLVPKLDQIIRPKK